MEKIRLVYCTIKELQEIFTKICLSYKGHYYDMVTLNRYENFDGENGVIKTVVLNEKMLDVNVVRALEKRKNDLLNRLDSNENLEYLAALDTSGFVNADSMAIVMYRGAKIVLNADGKFCLEEDAEDRLGLMINDEVYDVKEKRRVKVLTDDNIKLNDFCLRYVKIVPEEVLEIEDYMSLMLVGNEIIGMGNKPKVVVVGKTMEYSNN